MMATGTAVAQDTNKTYILPEEIQYSVWNVGRCDTPPMMTHIYGQKFFIQMMSGGHIITRIADIKPADSGPGAWNFTGTSQNQTVAVRMLDDGTMLHAFPVSIALGPWQDARAEEDNPYAFHLYHCPDMPDTLSLSNDMMRAFSAFNQADSACRYVAETNATEKNETCRAALFKVADTDHSASLDQAELEHLWNYAAWIGERKSCGDDSPPVPMHGNEDGPPFAAKALQVADTNRDGLLTMEEIKTFEPAFMITAEGKSFRVIIDSVRQMAGW